MRTVAILGLLLLVVLAWIQWPSTNDYVVPGAPPATATETAAGGTAASAEAAAAPTASVEATAERTEVPAASAVPAGPGAVLRGRCVDTHGQPIAGVEARLTGWVASSERLDAWRKDHDVPKGMDVKVASGADGVFEFRFWPPPPFQFSLRLTQAGFATVSSRWSQHEPGATKDLGDVCMPRSTRLRGRIVDSKGAPVAETEVHFLTAPRSGPFAPDSHDVGRSQADGTFTGYGSLIGGEYSVTVPLRTVVSPKTLTIAGDQAEQFVEVVVAAIDPSKSLAGIVVDERGSPVDGVRVRAMQARDGRSTDKEGRFLIPRPEQGGAEAVSLSLEREGYEPLTTTDTFRWGSTDIRISLQSALAVEVSVVDAEGAPVEDYQVRIFPRPGTASMSSSDYDVRSKGRHEGGRATIHGIRRGRHFLVVEPKSEELAVSPLVPVEVADPGPSVVTVTMTRNADRELRVRRPDGTPVAGAKVHLADLLAELARARPGQAAPATGAATKGVSPRMQVVRWARWGFSNADRALELQSVTTDAKGSARLHGPGDRTFALFLPGPGHVPTVVEDVRLSEAEPLVVTIGSGGALTGTVRPLTTISELRRCANLPPTGPVDESDRRLMPRIELHRGQGESAETHPAQLATISDDGTFSIADIPTGAWQVCLRWSHQRDTMSLNEGEDVAAVTLQEGETRQIEIDVAHLSPGLLEGIVLHNGVALANTRLMVTSSRGKDAQGNEPSSSLPVTTDVEGRFQLRVRAGECRIACQRQQGGVWSSLRAPESIHVVTGQTVAQTFHVKSGTVRVRLLDAQGQPVAQVPIELRDATGKHQQNLPPTDADGRTSGEVAVESFTAAVLPKHLQDQKAQMEFYRNNPGNPDVFAGVRLQCGTVQAQMGATTEVELRLPVAWPR